MSMFWEYGLMCVQMRLYLEEWRESCGEDRDFWRGAILSLLPLMRRVRAGERVPL